MGEEEQDVVKRPAKGSGKGRQTAEQKESQKDVVKRSKEEFYAGLPADELSSEEKTLRDALWDLLEDWKDPIPPTMTQAGTNAAIAAARRAFLPKFTSITEWIDKRIGGEIETTTQDNIRAGSGPGETYFHFRDELNKDALAAKLDAKLEDRARPA